MALYTFYVVIDGEVLCSEDKEIDIEEIKEQLTIENGKKYVDSLDDCDIDDYVHDYHLDHWKNNEIELRVYCERKE